MAIGDAIGQSIRYETLSDEEALADALLWADRAYADALVDIWRTVRKGRLATVTDGVRQILGRGPRSFGDWVGENIGSFVKRTRGP